MFGFAFKHTDPHLEAFKKTGATTTYQQINALKYLSVGLKGYSLFEKFYACYPIIGGTAASHSLNFRSIGTYKITWFNSPTHSSTGVDFNGSTQYGNTNLNANNVLTLNNTALCYYSREQQAGSAAVEIGCWNGATPGRRILYLLRTATNLLSSQQYENSANGTFLYSNTVTNGLSISTRTNSTFHAAYAKGNFIGSASTVGGTLPPGNIGLGTLINSSTGLPSAGNYSSKECAFAGISQGLTPADCTNLNTVVEQYENFLNRKV